MESKSLSEINTALKQYSHSYICSTRTHMQMISADSLRASTRAIHVAQLSSMADSRTERLHVLLTASNSRHCITHMYPAVVDVCGLSKEINATLE